MMGANEGPTVGRARKLALLAGRGVAVIEVTGARTSTFVGRSDALAQLSDEGLRAAEGNPRIVWVVGESGIGKTTLVRRALDGPPADRTVWVSGDESEASLAYGLITQAGAFLAGSGLVNLSPTMDPLEVGAKLLRGLASADGPNVVVVDDLQWADAPSAAALLFALRRLRVEPALVVVVTRPEAGEVLGEGWSRLLSDADRVCKIVVEGLSPEEIAELSAVVGVGRLDSTAAARLRDHTRGHPLHTRVLLEELGAPAIRDAIDVLPAPRSLSALTLAKIATHPLPAQHLIEAGAVLGQAFSLPLGSTVAGIADALPALDGAMAVGILRRESSGDVAFTHPLRRAAVYNDLSPTRRAELHLAAAGATSGLVTLHHRASAASGPDETLAGELEDVATNEVNAGRTSAAAAHLRMAATLSADPKDRDRRLLDAVESYFIGNDPARAKTWRTTIEACAESPQRAFVLGLVEFTSGRLRAAESLLSSASTAHGDPKQHHIASRASVGLAMTLLLEGRWADALAAAEASLQADAGWAVGVARYVQAMALMELGRSEELRAVLRSLEAEGPADAVVGLDVLGARGLMKFLNEDLAGANTDLSAVVDRAREGEPARFLTVSHSFRAETEYRLGLWDDALIHAELAVSLAEDAEQLLGLLFAHASAAQVYAGRGRFEQAEQHADALDALALLVPTWGGHFQSATVRALLAQARGDGEAMLKAALRFLDEPLRHTMERTRTWRWRALVVEAHLGAGQLDLASRALAELVDRVRTSGLYAAEADVRRLSGQLAEAHGEPEEALGAYTSPASHPAGSGELPFPLARLEIAHGRLLRRRGETRAAIDQLRSARAILSRLGAVPFLADCDAELEECGLRSPKASAGNMLALTPREEVVARLVASGLSNREVAAQLYVSAKAIEYHLGHIYAKLGVTSRRHLASQIGTN